MATQNSQPRLRLTSASEDASPPKGPDPVALRRALWLQSQTLFGVHVAAREIIGRENQLEKQEALCFELDRIATESRHLFEAMQEGRV